MSYCFMYEYICKTPLWDINEGVTLFKTSFLAIYLSNLFKNHEGVNLKYDPNVGIC